MPGSGMAVWWCRCCPVPMAEARIRSSLPHRRRPPSMARAPARVLCRGRPVAFGECRWNATRGGRGDKPWWVAQGGGPGRGRDLDTLRPVAAGIAVRDPRGLVEEVLDVGPVAIIVGRFRRRQSTANDLPNARAVGRRIGGTGSQVYAHTVCLLGIPCIHLAEKRAGSRNGMANR